MFTRPNGKPQISKTNTDKRGAGCPQFPAFSFIHLTRNKAHTFDSFGNSKREREVAQAKLVDRLIEVSGSEWKYWHGLPKKQGAEALPTIQLKAFPVDYVFTDDENFIVIRLKTGGGSARILGFRKDSCPTLHVFAFDFDFSAYSHGR